MCARSLMKFAHLKMSQFDDVLKHDYQKLKDALGKEPILFGISNEEHLLELEDWSRRFYNLKFYLEDELTSKVASFKQQTIRHRYTAICSMLLDELNTRKAQAIELHGVDEKTLTEQIKKLEQGILMSRKQVEKTEQQLQQQRASILQSVDNIVIQEGKQSVIQFKQAIQKVQTVEAVMDQHEQIEYDILQKFTKTLNVNVQQYLNNFIEDTVAETNDWLSELESDVESTRPLTLSLNVKPPVVEEVFEDQSYIEDRLEEQRQLQNALQEIQQQKELLEKNSEEAKRAREEVSAAIQDLGPYVPEYNVNGTTQTKEALQQIGMLVDIGTMFIPTNTAVSVLGKVGKIQKLGKLGKILSDTEKMTKVVNTAKTGLKGIQAKNNAAKDTNSEEVNPFALITVEHWLGKIGESIDGPITRVEDIEKANEYKQQEAKLKNEFEQKKLQEMREYENLKLLRTREQKIQKQLELNEKYRQQLEKEMVAEKQRLLADRSQKALATFKDQLLERFEKGVQTIVQNQQQKVFQLASKLLADLPNSIALRKETEIRQYKDQLEKALLNKQSSQEELATQEAIYNKYVSFLKEQMDPTIVGEPEWESK